MILAIALLLSLSMALSVMAQGSLGGDLDRASSRYAPAASEAGDAVGGLVAEAAEHFRNGRIDAAVTALDKAAGQAYATGATGKAFELGLTVAEARRSQGQMLAAARRYRDEALSNPRDPRAATAHFAACEAMAAITEPTPAQLDEYDELLKQHAASWPDVATAEVARWRRVELLAKRRQWDGMLARVRTVAPTDKHYERARALLVIAHSALLQSETSRERFEIARSDLEPIVLGSPPRWPEAWSPVQRDVAFTLARGAIDQGDDGVTYARKLLRVAIDRPPLPDLDWQKRAATLLVIAALAQADGEKADMWLSSVYRARPEQRRRLIAATRARLAQRAMPPSQQADQLLRTLSELTQPSTPDDAPTVQRAEALLQAGRDAEALRLYAELAEQQPDNRAVQVAYATLLDRSPESSDRDLALVRWRAIESRTEPSTDAWFDARLARLRLLVDRGDREAATKLLALTRLLAPTLGGERLTGDFERLADQISLPAAQ